MLQSAQLAESLAEYAAMNTSDKDKRIADLTQELEIEKVVRR